MSKKYLTPLIIILILIIVGAVILSTSNQQEQRRVGDNLDNQAISDSNNIKEEPTPEPPATEQPEVITSDIDTSDWQTYRNEELGFEFRYPEGWSLEKTNSEVVVYSETYKMGLSVNIEKTNKTLEQFINDYNNLDPTSRILEKKEVTIGGSTPATQLTASTSLGLDINFIFIALNNESYLISYYRFDEIHSAIIDSLHLIGIE